MNTSTSAQTRVHDEPSSNTHWVTQKLLEWVFLSALPVVVLLAFKQQLMLFWQWLLLSWGKALGLSTPTRWTGSAEALQQHLLTNNAGVPSTTTVILTGISVAVFWLASGFFSDRFHPLKIGVRLLCLIQGSACAFFAWAPERFPYTSDSHLDTLMSIGYGFMLAIGPMLALGWGVLKVPWLAKVCVPFIFLAFFALMLPHKALLHIWLLEHFSVLFMPVLFLLFGTLLDLCIFVALYALLASLTPPLTNAPSGPVDFT